MQFFNIRVFYECWRSASIGRPVYEIREIRLFEASMESFPQLAIQLHYILSCEDFTKIPIESIIVQAFSILFSLYSIASVIVYSDAYVVL